MGINLGNTGITKIYLGSNEITKAYLGDNVVYEGLPDYSGLNITNHFGLYKTQQSTIDYCLRIITNVGDTTRYYVFFDGSNGVTMNSRVSTTTSPTSSTLADLAAANSNWDVVRIYDHLGDGINGVGDATQNERGRARLISGGSLVTLNGKAAINFLGLGGLYYGSGLTALNSETDFSVKSIGNNTNSNSVGAIVGNSTSSSTSNDSRFVQFFDRRSNVIHSIIRDTTGEQERGNLLSQQNNADQWRVLTTIDDNANMVCYKDNVLQETEGITGIGAWVNDNFSIGSQRQNGSSLTGHWQETTVHDTNIDSTQRGDLNTLQDNFYNF